MGHTASDYILAHLYSDRYEIRTAYGKVKEVITPYVTNQFSSTTSMTITGLNNMDLNSPVLAYPTNMLPFVVNHHTANIKSFNIENISQYLRLIMFGVYDTPTKNVLISLASSTNSIPSQRLRTAHLQQPVSQ
jgi:hypothetical protein